MYIVAVSQSAAAGAGTIAARYCGLLVGW
jgi:hypothetical protein